MQTNGDSMEDKGHPRIDHEFPFKYLKINTLWKREDAGKKKGCIIPGDYSEEEFKSINRWSVMEKVDGCNTRIVFENRHYNDYGLPYEKPIYTIEFYGRTDDANLSQTPHVEELLENTFQVKKFKKMFKGAEHVILFGETYGKKIQEPCGSRYLGDEVGFILFGAWVDGWWLQRHSLVNIAESLEIPIVQDFGVLTKEEIIKLVSLGPNSAHSETPQRIEGVVCTSFPMMMYRGTDRPIMFKLKCKDYERLETKQKELRG